MVASSSSMRPVAIVVPAMLAAMVAAPAARADEAPATTDAGDVMVHIWADSDAVRLVRLGQPGEDGEETVCAPPCDQRVPRDGTYRIVGAGMPPTGMFSMQNANGRLTLDVQAGSSVQRAFGVGSAVVGVGALLFAGLYADWLSLDDVLADRHTDHLHDPILWGSLVGALVFGVGGGLLIATSGTWVRTSNGVSFGHASGPGIRAHRPRVTLTPTGLMF
jgi:hypothetical protein